MTHTTVPLDGIARTTVDGEIDLEGSLEMLRSVARDAAIEGRNLLVDLRTAQGKGLTFGDVFRVVRELERYQDAFCERIALLDTYNDAFEKTQFFEASAGHVGLSVRAFLTESEAVAWLEASPC